jgi:uncharacterized protein YlxP (DUF503 family)
MHVGVMRLMLEVVGARSLKDKRQVVRSFKERVKSRLGVSIAEVDHHDKLQVATFGVAVVSGDAAVCEDLLGKVTAMAGSLPNAVLADRASEIVPFGLGGKGVRGGIEQVDFGEDDLDDGEYGTDDDGGDEVDDGS